MSNSENVCKYSTPDNGLPYYLYCGFRWHFLQAKPGPDVRIIINSGLEIDIANKFHNGVYIGNGLEISFREETFESCNYINIIMSIKSTDSSISKFSIGNWFDTWIGGDRHNVSGLAGFRGYKCFDDSDSINFIFNNSQRVTPVSQASYSGWDTLGFRHFVSSERIDDKTTYQSTPGISFSWSNIEISQGKVQEIRYSIGIGEYFVGYKIDIKTERERYYEPESDISLNIDILGKYIGDHLKITRFIDSKNEETIYDGDDNGEHVNIYDNFTLPYSVGYHTIKYVTRNNQSVEDVKEISILVNIKPVLTISPSIADEYSSGEEVSFIATIYDDSNVSFIVNIDSTNIINETIDCQITGVKKDFKIKLPIVQSDEQHSIYIVCLDKYEVRSNLITKHFNITVEPPKIKVNNNISYLQTPYSRIFLTGEVSYENRQSYTCLYSNIEKRFETNSSCQMIGPSWTQFNISREIPPVLGGIYKLEIYASDLNDRRSDIIRQFFAVAIRSNCDQNCYDMLSLRNIIFVFEIIVGGS